MSILSAKADSQRLGISEGLRVHALVAVPMRRSPAPWTVEALEGCSMCGLKVMDANEQSLAYLLCISYSAAILDRASAGAPMRFARSFSSSVSFSRRERALRSRLHASRAGFRGRDPLPLAQWRELPCQSRQQLFGVIVLPLRQGQARPSQECAGIAIIGHTAERVRYAVASYH